MIEYLGWLAMIQITWLIGLVIVSVSSDVLHDYAPIRDTWEKWGGNLKGSTYWYLVNPKGYKRMLNSDCEIITHKECVTSILMWAILPSALLYYMVFRKIIPFWLVIISSAILWSLPMIYEVFSSVDITISWKGVI